MTRATRVWRVLAAGSLAWLALAVAAVAADTLLYFHLLGLSHGLVRLLWRMLLWTSPWVVVTVAYRVRT